MPPFMSLIQRPFLNSSNAFSLIFLIVYVLPRYFPLEKREEIYQFIIPERERIDSDLDVDPDDDGEDEDAHHFFVSNYFRY